MSNYAATYFIFDGVSNIYMLSTATVFLAVIIALYCANFLKDENEEEQSTNRDNEVATHFEEQYQNVDGDEDIIDHESSAHHSEDSKNFNADAAVYYEDNYDDDDDDDEDKIDFNNEDIDDEEHVDIDVVDNFDDADDDEDMSANGLLGKLRTARLKQLEARWSNAQLEEERRIEKEQLTAIYELLKKQEADLNMREIDECELKEQLSLYR